MAEPRRPERMRRQAPPGTAHAAAPGRKRPFARPSDMRAQASLASEQTLFVAMEEIRLRLRDKGISLASAVARSQPESEGPSEGRHNGRRDGGRDGDAGERDGTSARWQAGR